MRWQRRDLALALALVVAGCAGSAGARSPAGPLPSASAPSTSELSMTALSSPAASPSIPSTARPTLGVSPSPWPAAALTAHLAGPVGLVFDHDGALYISQCTFEAGGSYVLRLDQAGTVRPYAGTGSLGFSGDGGPATEAEIQCPAGMAFGPDGALYVADHANNRVRRIGSDGIITTVAGSGPAGVNLGSFSGDGGPATKATLQEPWDIAFDVAGDLFIADRDNDRVRKVAPGGTITTIAGTGEHGGNGDGHLAVHAQLCGPQGVAVDRAGEVFIADDCDSRVRKVDRHGIITTIAGTGVAGFSGDGGLATKAGIDGPSGLLFDPGGALLVSTNPGLRVRRLDPDGMISTIAGNGLPGSPVDGSPATTSSFVELYGLALDRSGDLFIADGNASVYKVDASGIVKRAVGAIQ